MSRWFSPAKVNWHLSLGPRRKDGFHSLLSLFQLIAWGDIMEITPGPAGMNQISTVGVDLPADVNLINRVYHRLACERDLPPLHVSLSKRLPAGGGIGGGSSNAGTLLRFFYAQDPEKYPKDLLRRVALDVGSDIPFFVADPEETAALVGGRGEELTYLDFPKELPLLFLIPSFGISTAEAYRRWDQENLIKPQWLQKQAKERDHLPDDYSREPSHWPFRNDFVKVLQKGYPDIQGGLGDLKASGALYANMSGSGSLLYGVYSSVLDRDRAADQLKKRWNLQKTFSLARIPDPSYD